MSSDYVDHLERGHFNVDTWLDSEIDKFPSSKIEIFECSMFIEPRDDSIAVLSFPEFVKLCAATDQKTTFLYREKSLIDENIRLRIEREHGDDENLEYLVKAFNKEYEATLSKTREICENHRYLVLYFSIGRIIVVTGAICEAYEELLDAIENFCGEIENKKRLTEELKNQKIEDAESQLTELLLVDSGFSSLRGKRKRSVYVEDKYGKQFHVIKDMDLDYLVERVSDRLDILKQT